MVKVETVLFGEIEIRDDQIIRFPGGIPGFEDHEKFTIIEPDPSVPFSYLQSIEDQELHFILADPFVFFKSYEFEVPRGVQEEIEIDNPEVLAIKSIVSVQDKLEEATANLLAPIVINTKKMLAKQVVLHDTVYTTKHKLFELAVSE